MRIAEVIGTVTLNRCHPSVTGFRWVIGVPFSLQALRQGGRGDGEDVVIFDNLAVGVGDKVGFSEGGEAAAPFYPEKKPVDAFCGIQLDRVIVNETK